VVEEALQCGTCHPRPQPVPCPRWTEGHPWLGLDGVSWKDSASSFRAPTTLWSSEVRFGQFAGIALGTGLNLGPGSEARSVVSVPAYAQF